MDFSLVLQQAEEWKAALAGKLNNGLSVLARGDSGIVQDGGIRLTVRSPAAGWGGPDYRGEVSGIRWRDGSVLPERMER